jgi:hypothetical protein
MPAAFAVPPPTLPPGCRWYVGGRVPYGWRRDNPDFISPEPGEREVIALAKALRQQGATYRQISETLVERGHHPRLGGDWNPAQIMRLLR